MKNLNLCALAFLCWSGSQLTKRKNRDETICLNLAHRGNYEGQLSQPSPAQKHKVTKGTHVLSLDFPPFYLNCHIPTTLYPES